MLHIPLLLFTKVEFIICVDMTEPDSVFNELLKSNQISLSKYTSQARSKSHV